MWQWRSKKRPCCAGIKGKDRRSGWQGSQAAAEDSCPPFNIFMALKWPSETRWFSPIPSRTFERYSDTTGKTGRMTAWRHYRAILRIHCQSQDLCWRFNLGSCSLKVLDLQAFPHPPSWFTPRDIAINSRHAYLEPMNSVNSKDKAASWQFSPFNPPA